MKHTEIKFIFFKTYYSICEETGKKIYDTELMQKEFTDQLIKIK